MLKAWELQAMDRAGYGGITEEHIRDVANALLETGKTEIDRKTFDQACGRCLIDPACFTRQDLDRLQEALNHCG